MQNHDCIFFGQHFSRGKAARGGGGYYLGTQSRGKTIFLKKISNNGDQTMHELRLKFSLKKYSILLLLTRSRWGFFLGSLILL